MRNGIHFISGLPRAGSTLLSALLRQNPAVHADISSPVFSLVSAMQHGVSQGNEGAMMIDDAQREALLRGVFDSFYGAIHPTQTVFDTNRGWCSRVDLLAALFPDAKIICCVRPISWILDSIERLLRQNRWELSKMFNFETSGTVYSRADGLMSRAGLVGYALAALKEGMHSVEAGRLLLLPYEVMTRQPEYAMRAIYEFTGLPLFEHDFENVSFDAAEFDARLGMPGLHRVRPQVRHEPRESVLPPDLRERFEKENIWRNPDFNTRGVRIV